MNWLVRIIVIPLIIMIITAMVSYAYLNSLSAKLKGTPTTSFEVTRFIDSPIITIDLDESLKAEADSFGYVNINGPSLIRVPEWVQDPLGQFYLYFAHHKGESIRMAYADTLAGPWTLYRPGILHLEESTFATQVGAKTTLNTLLKYVSISEAIALFEIGKAAQQAWEHRQQKKQIGRSPTTPHIASPEVIIDHKKQQIRMYVHGVVEGTLQLSKVGLSTNGIDFEMNPEIIACPYLRVFSYKSMYYGLAMPGFLYRSQNGVADFEVRSKWLLDTNVRHNGLLIDDEMLYVFYSRVGDDPEHILMSEVDISSDNWDDWIATEPISILKPEKEWEGAYTTKGPSFRGEIGIAAQQLRDPDLFIDKDGLIFMLYTGSGEGNIGICLLTKITAD